MIVSPEGIIPVSHYTKEMRQLLYCSEIEYCLVLNCSDKVFVVHEICYCATDFLDRLAMVDRLMLLVMLIVKM